MTKEDVDSNMRGGESEKGRQMESDQPSNQTAAMMESREARRVAELLEDGGLGYIPREKETQFVRVAFENVNSIGPGWKIDKLNKDVIPSLEVDVFLFNELQQDWRAVPTEKRFIHQLQPGISRRGLFANNQTERSLGKDQPGGTGLVAMGRISDLVREIGCDNTQLGHWCWITIDGGAGVKTRIVSVYNPVQSRNGKGHTVWEQHQRFYQRNGDFLNPSEIFQTDLLELIRPWREAGDKVIIGMDANQNVYSGKLARALGTAPYDMTCMFQEVNGCEAPPSFHMGSTPITNNNLFWITRSCSGARNGFPALHVGGRSSINGHRCSS